ncbi:hypothetical protein BH10PSE12_BH10PSE12_12840 [soil metagenome]
MSPAASKLVFSRSVLENGLLPISNQPRIADVSRMELYLVAATHVLQPVPKKVTSDDAAAKLLYLILNRSEIEWKMPPREWTMPKAQFAVIFGERFIHAMAA